MNFGQHFLEAPSKKVLGERAATAKDNLVFHGIWPVLGGARFPEVS